ncbi:MAG: ParB/RepB/Spo0J family partition protein [Anaerosomatales bacterium]|nr:ParB/RepB/Spo0J family partition protein [Anaerosomatales bacterium]
MNTTIQMVPLDTIHDNPNQPRAKLTGIAELARSIDEVGLMSPVVLMDNGDGKVTIAGHRRRAAFAKLGLTEIPAIVLPADIDAKQLDMILAENRMREDLTVTEVAHGLQTRLTLGDDIDTIARATGISKKDIAAVETAMALPKTLLKVADSAGASLSDMATLEELRDHLPDYSVKELTSALGTPSFRHKADFLRDKVETAKKRQAVLDDLESKGITVVQAYSARTLDSFPEDNKAPRNHAKLPCHAAWVDYRNKVVPCCTDPASHGLTGSLSPSTPKDPDEERIKRSNRKILRATAQARGEFIASHVKEKNSATMECYVLSELLEQGVPAWSAYNNPVPEGYMRVTKTNRFNRILAMVLLANENSLEAWVKATGCIESAPEVVTRHLAYLKAAGYAASTAEDEVIAGTSPLTAPVTDEDASK